MKKPVTLPKRLAIEEVRSLLGEAAAERLLTAFLRRKAEGVVPVSEADIEKAEAMLKGQSPKGGRLALGKLVVKRFSESKLFKVSFANYLSGLRKAANEQKGVSRTAGRKARKS